MAKGGEYMCVGCGDGFPAGSRNHGGRRLCYWRRLTLLGFWRGSRGCCFRFGRYRFATIAIQHDFFCGWLRGILARQGNAFDHRPGIIRRPVQEYRHDQYGHNDEYDRSDYAFLQCSIH